MKFYFIIAIILLLNAFFIISENNLKLNSIDNVKTFSMLYADWFTNIGENISTISGNAVRLNWVPEKQYVE